MRIHLETGDSTNLIRTYSTGRILVGESTYTGSLIVLADRLITDWPPQHHSSLSAEYMQVLSELNCEVILLGTGRRLHFPDPAALAPLYHSGVGIEIMDTGAACRTYNILMGEGRKVAAALLPIEKD